MKSFVVSLIASMMVASCCTASNMAPAACGGVAKRQAEGDTFQVRNVGQAECLQGGNPFQSTELVEMRACSTTQMSIQQFTVRQGRGGVMLTSPWNNDTEERCVYTGNQEGQYLWTNDCNEWCPVFAWNLEKVGEDQFLLRHAHFNMCARAEGRYIRMRESCDANDKNQVWEMQK